MLFRVMIPDTFINVEADSEAEAEAKVAKHIKEFPPHHEDSKIQFVSWEAFDEPGPDI